MADDSAKLEAKVDALLEHRIPALEVGLARLDAGQANIASKLDSLSAMMTEHISSSAKEIDRVQSVEVQVASLTAGRIEKDRAKDRWQSWAMAILGAIATIIAAVMAGWHGHRIMLGG